MINKIHPVLEDAYCTRLEKVSRDKISVILGVASSTELLTDMASKIQRPVWQRVLRESGLPESQVQDICNKIYDSYTDWNEDTFPGMLGNVVAGRIANCFNLRGINCVVDAACASSHAAINTAIRELQLGHSDLVISGGADTLNGIFMYMCFTRTHALSLTEDCRPFSNNADGTMLGEGIGMIALRRLEDAERDGDKIYAVIRGVGASSDGKGKSVFAPSADGQAHAIIRAYDGAGYGLDRVELIEAHGTATFAGDIAEFEGLKKAMSHFTPEAKRKCAIGSIKSQIGHTKAAAGTAALIKTVMSLHHKVLPPTIKVNKPNPKLDIENSPFYLNTATRPWIHEGDSTRKAGVSAFGFGGSNFHITVEEYRGKGCKPNRIYHSTVHLLLFSVEDTNELEKSVNIVLDEIKNQGIETIARELQIRFNVSCDKRLAVIVNSEQEAADLLEISIHKIKLNPKTNMSIPGKVYYGTGTVKGKVAFLFPGQGSQYVNMGADIAVQFNDAREVWDKAAGIDLGTEERLHTIVFPHPTFDKEEKNKQLEVLKKTQWAQPAIGTASASILAILKKLGVKPDFVAGHSYGEVTALYEAGVIGSIEEFIMVSRKRGELMAAASTLDGAMTAVMTSQERVDEALREASADLCIANVNSPSQIVISGETSEIEKAEAYFEGKGVNFKRLSVATAFHSKVVEKSVEPFYNFLKTINLNEPSNKVFSNSTANLYGSNVEEIRKTLASQLAKPVYFRQQIEKMYDEGVRVFIEVGPGAVLSKLVDDCLKGKEYMTVFTDRNGQNSVKSFWNALGMLSISGINIFYEALWEEFNKPWPKEAKKLSPVAVQINGSNYGKPYPPKGGAEDLPKPNPERTEENLQCKKEANITKNIKEEGKGEAAMIEKRQVENKNEKIPEKRLVNTASATRNNVYEFEDERLKVLQILQQNTFEAQKMYQKLFTESHLAFLQASEEAFRQLVVLGGGFIVSDRVMENQKQTNIDRLNEAFSPDAVTPYGEEKLFVKQDDSIQGDYGIDEKYEKHYEVAANQGRAVDLNLYEEKESLNQEEPPHGVVTEGAADYKKILMEVVAEKTGYPEEMLNLTMDLESDLGIDSIKRVEILSTLKAKLPELVELDTAKLAVMKTLQEILSHVSGNLINQSVVYEKKNI